MSTANVGQRREPATGGGVTLVLAMTPDRTLAPNASSGKSRWSIGPKIAAVRQQAFLLARDQVGEMVAGDVEVFITICWGKVQEIGPKRSRMAQARRLDWDSATSICKPVIDGALVDTGLL